LRTRPRCKEVGQIKQAEKAKKEQKKNATASPKLRLCPFPCTLIPSTQSKVIVAIACRPSKRRRSALHVCDGILDLAVDGTEFLLDSLLQLVQSLDGTLRLVEKAGLGVGARIVSSLVDDVGVVVAASAVPDENLDIQKD
jgi:hypothetical protein